MCFGISAITIDLVYKIHYLYVPKLVPIVFGYYASATFCVATMVCLFIWKSFCTNKLALMLDELNFEKTYSSQNLGAKNLLLFVTAVAGSLYVWYLFLYFQITVPSPMQALVPDQKIFLNIIATIYFAYAVYIAVFTILFLLFFVEIFTILRTDIKELKHCIAGKTTNSNEGEDMCTFMWFTVEYTKIVNLVEKIVSIWSFDFALFMGHTLNNFICSVYAVTYVNQCNTISWDLFKLNMALSIAYFILFTLPAASVHSEVCTQTLPSKDISNSPKESHDK